MRRLGRRIEEGVGVPARAQVGIGFILAGGLASQFGLGLILAYAIASSGLFLVWQAALALADGR